MGIFGLHFFVSGVITKVKLTRWINRMFAKLSQNFNPIDRRFVGLVGCCQFWTRVVPKSFVSIGKACTLYLSKAMRRSLVPSWGLLWLETGFNDVKKNWGVGNWPRAISAVIWIRLWIASLFVQ
jgi:hypothetical protein